MLIGRRTIGTISHMSGGLVIPTPFVKSWQDMIQYNYEYFLKPTERILYTEATVSYHSFARDGLVDSMRGEWILMLDTDIAFEPDLAARMINKMNKHNIDVLTGIYPYKGTIHAPVLYGYNPKTGNRFILGDWDKSFDVIECDGAGAGCLMFRWDVVKKIKATGQSLFSIIEPFSEDNSFFIRCRENGIKTYFSPNIQVRHLIYDELSIEKDYPEEMRKSMIKRESDVAGFK